MEEVALKAYKKTNPDASADETEYLPLDGLEGARGWSLGEPLRQTVLLFLRHPLRLLGLVALQLGLFIAAVMTFVFSFWIIILLPALAVRFAVTGLVGAPLVRRDSKSLCGDCLLGILEPASHQGVFSVLVSVVVKYLLAGGAPFALLITDAVTQGYPRTLAAKLWAVVPWILGLPLAERVATLLVLGLVGSLLWRRIASFVLGSCLALPVLGLGDGGDAFWQAFEMAEQRLGELAQFTLLLMGSMALTWWGAQGLFSLLTAGTGSAGSSSPEYGWFVILRFGVLANAFVCAWTYRYLHEVAVWRETHPDFDLSIAARRLKMYLTPDSGTGYLPRL